MYEFYIAQSIIDEALHAKGQQQIDEEKSVLRLAYLADDLVRSQRFHDRADYKCAGECIAREEKDTE